MKRIMAMVFVGLFLFVGVASADLFPLPNVAITVDGSIVDWVGIDAILSDPQGDSIDGAGTDIKSIYLAQDDNYLYWRMDLYNPPFDLWNETLGVSRGPGITFYSITTDWNYLGGVTEQPWWGDGPNESNIAKLIVSPWSWVSQYSGPEYGSYGDVFEGKIPIEIFDGIEVNFLLAYYHDGESNVLVDEVSKWVGNPIDPVPEPTTMLLLGTGLIGLAGVRRLKLKK